MRSKSLAILLGILLIVGIGGFALVKYGVLQRHISLGLDLQGGVHVVLEAVDTPEAPVKPDSMDRVKAIIDNRVNQLGVKEPTIQKEGQRRLVIELPGVKNAQEAIELIGKTAQMTFVAEDKVVLKGSDLAEASAATNPTTNEPYVSIKFTAEGAKKFADVTTMLVNKYPNYGDPKRRIAIYLDQKLLTDPNVKEPITGGQAQISGGYKTLADANKDAILLRSGALPVKLDQVAVQTVGPTLGADSLQKSKVAGIIGLSAIFLFMLAYYRLPGLLANVALIVYTFIVLSILAALNATLTLPGIAGMLLSIGMAVDANVIIFERLKEELRDGNSLRRSVEAGFSRAFTTIFDSNATTVIAAIVLYYLGSGTIRGFALNLIIGIIASMFTAISFTRWLLRLTVDTGISSKKLFRA